MKKTLMVCLLCLFVIISKASNITIISSSLPSDTVIDTIKLYYGPTLKTYTNYVLYPMKNIVWITNNPAYMGYGFSSCTNEWFKNYLQMTITNVVPGQSLYFRLNYIWKDGNEGSVIWESRCPMIVPIGGNRPPAPQNFKVLK